MSTLSELLASDHRQTLEFFITGLRDVSKRTVVREELLYNASVLAHYAQVSTQSSTEWPCPANLSKVFDHFVLDQTLVRDAETVEIAGTQCLLLAGFFEDQMRSRHNIRWFSELGGNFFRRAATFEVSPRKANLLLGIAQNFEPWRQTHALLSRTLRDNQYLIKPS